MKAVKRTVFIFAKNIYIMRKIVLSILMLAATVITANAQQKWKELDEFHEIMSKTFHPSEEGKLDPIRTRSQEMVDKAQAWKKSTAPEGFDQKAVKKNLKELVDGAKEINELVKNKAADAVLKEKLAKLHDVFHGIVEKCEKEEDHH
jgi:hypothetical protein